MRKADGPGAYFCSARFLSAGGYLLQAAQIGQPEHKQAFQLAFFFFFLPRCQKQAACGGQIRPRLASSGGFPRRDPAVKFGVKLLGAARAGRRRQLLRGDDVP